MGVHQLFENHCTFMCRLLHITLLQHWCTYMYILEFTNWSFIEHVEPKYMNICIVIKTSFRYTALQVATYQNLCYLSCKRVL